MLRKLMGVFAILMSGLVLAKETDLSFYRPFTETLQHAPMVIGAKLLGQCAEQSRLIKREDAWRCEAQGRAYDPCFVAPFGPHLSAVCMESPWLNQGMEITVSMPLDNSQHEMLDMSRTYPWALELQNGEKCQAVESDVEYDGLPVHYRCQGQSTLIGHLQRCQNTWSILQHQSNGVDTVMITRAWF